MSPHRTTAKNALESLRQRLLDLTGRNRLLHFRHTKKGSLRIIDELPDQLTETLLAGTAMRFQAVPEPTKKKLVEARYFEIDESTGEEKRLRDDPSAKEWAEQLNFQTSYEVPTAMTDNRHSDKAIQTLFYPYELEARLKNIRQTAESAIQEMGTNILYLAFGFLEWFEHDNGEPCIAPLFLIPVRLERGRLNQDTRTYEYKIAYSEEDIMPNLSLKEKLRVDFAMALPELNENTSPEKYFEEVLDLIQKNKPSWKLRRHITLALLNFSKLLMYLDLDPSRWPKYANILDHPIVMQLLSGGENEDSSFGKEYSIDEVKDIHNKYPLVDDADSSQHSALIDAVKGKNLVIEGPPGTGKSQTITNLIAAAMAQEKKVLFVAEKLAALEVVHRRLNNVGLGDFCLELHSHKSQKQQIIENISLRLDNKGNYPHPKDIEFDITRYEKLKTDLNNHAKRINRSWKNTGKSPHQIFMSAARYRKAVDVNPSILHPEGLDGDSLNPTRHKHIEDQVEKYHKFYRHIIEQLNGDTELQQHPWYGVHNIQISDHYSVVEALNAWQGSLINLIDKKKEYAQWLGCEPSGIANNLNEVISFLDDMEKLTFLNGDEILDRLPILRGDVLESTQRYLQLFERIQSIYTKLTEKVDSKILQHPSGFYDLIEGGKQIKRLVHPQIKLGTLATTIDKLKEIQKQLDELHKPLRKIQNDLGGNLAHYLLPTKEGLTEFNRLIDLVTRLKPFHWKYRDERFNDDELDDLLPKLRDELETVHKLRDELQGVFRIDALPSYGELRQIGETINSGGIFRWFKPDWRAARRKIIRMAVNHQVKFSSLIALLETAEEFSQKRPKLDENSQYQNALGKHMKGLDTDLATLESLRDWYKKIRQQYGVGFGPKVALGDTILSLPMETARVVRSLSEQGVRTQISSLLDDLVNIREVFAPFSDLQSDSAILAGEESVICRLLLSLNESYRRCAPLMQDKAISIAELTGHINLLFSLEQTISEWRDTDCDNEIFQGQLGLEPGLEADNTTSLSTLRNTLVVAASIDDASTNVNIQRKIYAEPENSTFDTLKRFGEQLKELVGAQKEQYVAFEQKTGLDKDEWVTTSGGDFDGLISKNTRALDSDDLQGWIDYVRTRKQIVKMGLTKLIEAVEQRSIDIQCIEDAYKAGVFDVLAREILHEKPELGQFSSRLQESIQDKFRKYDSELKKLQCLKIACKIDQMEVPIGHRGALVSKHTDRHLLQHERTKRKRHLPIRKLLDKAGKALVALKPCFMMGPMSVAQYLAPGRIEFDLVIMDEASQIKPQDALGAIARGKQLVVVGDSKQLPPTSFFDRVIDDEEEDPTAIEESESILDATLPIFSKRRLRWHYRSKHESLIKFSNHSFYNNDLVLFPSPIKDSDNYGVQIKPVRGCFINRKNIEEVKYISEAVRGHLMKKPEESLGVVAMNLQQRRAIEDAIEMLAKDDNEFQACYENNLQSEEPLFIKNLESVQGDEREVIFISMTYGPQTYGGRVPQRFGPINSETGWRRLNVLLTRAKKNMRVFTSMVSDDIVVDAQSRRGVCELRNFLLFCETGRLPQRVERETGRSPDSDFEIAVMEALRDEGFEGEPQVGAAGYFIDVAVIDPGNPGRFLMGIECDGAIYHSAKSARDRDQLRQKILEEQGWKIRRIWSTDWFKNPNAQLKPIIKELNELRTPEIARFDRETESDTEQIANITEESRQQYALSEECVLEKVDLEKKLLEFDRVTIRKKFPDTPDNERLLRPAILEALLKYKPTSKSEFHEYIPGYLRQSTSLKEAKQHLEQVLNIIHSSI